MEARWQPHGMPYSQCTVSEVKYLLIMTTHVRAAQIPWRAGRVDAPEETVTPDGRLPAADKGNPMATAQGLRDVFYRMGFDDREIVALSGAHALGKLELQYPSSRCIVAVQQQAISL